MPTPTTATATATHAAEQLRRLVGGLLVLVLVAAGLVTGVLAAPSAGAATTEQAFATKINNARAGHGLPRYVVRSDLAAVARAQARRMAAQNRLYHNPNLARDVRNWRWVGENVGYSGDVTTLHRAFMNSAPHRANILDRDYTQVGIGAVWQDGRLWVAEVFRQPARAYAAAKAKATGYTRVLHHGVRGADVKKVQRRLGLRATGYYGASTTAAVSRFQKRLGWRGHGNVGRATWARLF